MRMGVALMNRAEEVQLFRKSREVSVLPREDLVLSVLKEPVLPPNHTAQSVITERTTSEDDDEINRVRQQLFTFGLFNNMSFEFDTYKSSGISSFTS
jgi:hypothetical protein